MVQKINCIEIMWGRVGGLGLFVVLISQSLRHSMTLSSSTSLPADSLHFDLLSENARMRAVLSNMVDVVGGVCSDLISLTDMRLEESNPLVAPFLLKTSSNIQFFDRFLNALVQHTPPLLDAIRHECLESGRQVHFYD